MRGEREGGGAEERCRVGDSLVRRGISSQSREAATRQEGRRAGATARGHLSCAWACERFTSVVSHMAWPIAAAGRSCPAAGPGERSDGCAIDDMIRVLLHRLGINDGHTPSGRVRRLPAAPRPIASRGVSSAQAMLRP